LQPLMKKVTPISNPYGFTLMKTKEKLLIITSQSAKKTQNLKNRPFVYFSIDDESPPFKGVKGKGAATIVEDPNRIVPQAQKISIKYLGTLDLHAAKEMTNRSKNGVGILVEISPKFFLHGILVKGTS
jgi:hypothetical protein